MKHTDPVYKHPLANIYFMMKQRCYNTNHTSFPNYGGRGIKVCDEWLKSFWKFVEDVGERPEGCTLDRVDNGGDYTPDNCRWATPHEQSMNRRMQGNNTTGMVGVYWHSKGKKWTAEVYRKGVKTYLGLFSAKEEAVQAREDYITNQENDGCL